MLRHMALYMALGGLLLAAQSQRTVFQAHRKAASDLEVSGLISGIPGGQSRFISRDSLLQLPQVELTIQQSEETSNGSHAGLPVKGIYLDQLAELLGAPGEAVAAICTDGYTSTFPPRYIHIHRPVFVLTVEGLTPHDWAAKNSAFDAGPYFVGYHDFRPAFKVLSHADLPAQPDGITKIAFGAEEQLYPGIMPGKDDHFLNSAEAQGYRIARQNCFRCHNAGVHGGTKAGVSWAAVGSIASHKPAYFAAWVRSPQSINAKAGMPPNPEYDDATLRALQRYFATFAVRTK